MSARKLVRLGIDHEFAPCAVCRCRPSELAYPTKGKVRAGVCEPCARKAVELFTLRDEGKIRRVKVAPFRRREVARR